MLNRIAKVEVGVLEHIQVELKANESVWWAACCDLIHKGALANERWLVEVDESIEADLVRRHRLAWVMCGARGEVVDVGHDQARLKSRHVERLHPSNAQRVRRACCDQRIPHGERCAERHEELVAEIPGVAGAREPHGDAANGDVGAAEEAEIAHVAADRGGEHIARARPLQRESADRFGLVFNGDVQAFRCGLEPAVLRPGGGPEVGAVREQRNGAVIEHAAGLIAPRGVDDLHRLDAINTASDDSVNELRGVRAGQAVLAHRGDIEEGGREADGMVFQVVGWHIGVGDEESRPVAPAACLV